MCGISGFISANFTQEDLIDMTNAIKHRGPDAQGHYFNKEKGIGLGHRRLSILDLSNAANQPMSSSCGRFRMVYNGEVYNYLELKSKIGEFNWKTSSDTEVILEAFSKWGTEFVHELNGMFAIAIYDQLKNKLFLFRDRMGIKPLFYFFDDNNLIFSSELKSINKNKSINFDSIYSYLHLGYIPSEETINQNTFKLKPGSYIEFYENKIKTHCYWKPENKILNETFNNFKSSKKTLKGLLKDSVKQRLISDVPIGTFLSGGTDSSLISAIAQEVNGKPINTFSIGFEDAKHNESHHAKKVANHLKTNHHEFILKEKDAINELEAVMGNFDEPFTDSSALPTMLVSKMARKYVTVCLSGDGGDELFMGYGAYNWAKRINHPLYKNLRIPISKILSYSSNNKFKRAGLVFNSPKINWKSHIFSQEQVLFSEKEINTFLTKGNYRNINKINEEINLNRKLSYSESLSFYDLKNYLVDDLLVKVDRSSMFTSLEARVPLLDHNIIEFAINLNENLKIKNSTQKYILKELLYEYVPRKIMDRPKWGFTIPLSKWLKNELYYLIEKYLNDNILDELKIYNNEVVKNYIYRYLKGEDYLWNRIWSLIILNKYLKENCHE